MVVLNSQLVCHTTASQSAPTGAQRAAMPWAHKSNRAVLFHTTFGCCRLVHVTVKVEKDGETLTYEYKKPLPEDIEPERCTHKVTQSVWDTVLKQ